jgi:hypothetical protein
MIAVGMPVAQHPPGSRAGLLPPSPLRTTRASCRDRNAARATVGREFPTCTLSVVQAGASFHRGSRFRKPPCDPGSG